jgi:hypothetical protein
VRKRKYREKIDSKENKSFWDKIVRNEIKGEHNKISTEKGKTA